MTDPIAFNALGAAILSTLSRHYTGNDRRWRHSLRRKMLMTEGVVFIAKEADANWLTDIVASHQHTAKVAREPFQVWTLYVREKDGAPLSYVNGASGQAVSLGSSYEAVVVCTDGNDTTSPLVVQCIPFTDFPFSPCTLWLENNVLMLPGER